MSFIELVIILVLVGVVLWIINRYEKAFDKAKEATEALKYKAKEFVEAAKKTNQ